MTEPTKRKRRTRAELAADVERAQREMNGNAEPEGAKSAAVNEPEQVAENGAASPEANNMGAEAASSEPVKVDDAVADINSRMRQATREGLNRAMDFVRDHAELDQEPKAKSQGLSVDDQLKAVQLQMAEFQLEDLRDRVEQARQKKQDYHAQVLRREAHYRKERSDVVREQALCPHRKGGMGEGFNFSGEDSNFSTIKFQLPNTAWYVMCSRCSMEWHRGTTATRLFNQSGDTGLGNHTGISYMEAMRFPSDNEISGACLFLIPHEVQPGVAAQLAALAAANLQGAAI